MKKFVVEITETLRTTVTVEANTEADAINIVHAQYLEEDIVLDADDFDEVDFIIIDDITLDGLLPFGN